MYNVTNDVSTLTTIPEKILDKLLEKFIYSICEDILEDTLNNVTVTELDLGLGVLYIKHEDLENIHYKFIPSDNLQKLVTDTVTKKLNLLEDVLNTSLAQKVMNLYKDIC